MSKGIGENYLHPEVVKYHTQTIKNCYVRNDAGFKITMPKYYKDKIYTEQQRKDIKYLQAKRTIESEQKTLQKLQAQYNEKDVNKLLSIIEARKLNVKFDTRLNDVL